MEFANNFLYGFENCINEIVYDKVKEYLNKVQNRRKVQAIISNLDNFLKQEYGENLYYNYLDKYMHNGKINFEDDYQISSFYYTLICAFLNNDNSFIGENRFIELHLDKIRKIYPKCKSYEQEIKKCFGYFYIFFKNNFGNLSDEIKSLSIDIKSDMHDEFDLTHNLIKDEFAKIDAYQITSESIKETDNTKPTNNINNDNNEYIEKYKDILFLESRFDDNQATLKDVYIKPSLSDLNFDFSNWLNGRNSRILLLYGKAGIGKTSFIAWSVYTNSFNKEYNILALRNYISILDSENAWESIKKCFQCEDDIFIKISF